MEQADRRGCLHGFCGELSAMRFRVKDGLSARRFVFDRTPKAAPAPSVSPRAADLENPYGRYYGTPRSREDLIKQRHSASAPDIASVRSEVP